MPAVKPVLRVIVSIQYRFTNKGSCGCGVSPAVPHPGLEPDTMSLRPLAAVEYKRGFRNPNDGLPFARR